LRTFIAFATALALFAATTLSPNISVASIVTPYAAGGSQPVVDGVTHEWGSSQSEFIPGATEENPDPQPDYATQEIDILRVDTDAPDLHFETSLPAGNGALPSGQVNSRQRTTGQALRGSRPGHRVVAAINGDFWRTRNDQRSPISLNIRNGELVAVAPGQRGAIGFMDDGSPIIGRPTVQMSMTLPDTTVVPLGGVNQARDPDEVIFYTPSWGSTTKTPEVGTEVVLSGVTLPLPVTGTFAGAVVSVGSGIKNTTIPRDSVVLSATGLYAPMLAALAPNDSVQLTVSIEAPWQDVVNAVGGLRILVHEGVPATDFTTMPELIPNARMSAGITADGDVILVTLGTKADGQDGLSQGDMAQLMASLGAVEAINLDGGGSATMVVDPAGEAPRGIVNTPIDGYERRVNTSLLLVSTVAEPDAVAPTVTAPVMRFTPGTTAGKSNAAVDISWQATDADGVITRTELQRLVAGVWEPVTLPSPTVASINRRPKFNRDFQYRVRVTDDDGYQSDWSVGRTYRIGAINERAAAIVRTGKWPIVDRSWAIGGKIRRNSAKTTSGRTAALSYSAVQVAWIGPRGASSGVASVQLDGALAGTVTLTRNTLLARAVLFLGPALDETTFTVAPTRSIKLTNVSARTRPYVDLDAFLLLTAR
jgi:hypothetical protein